MLLGEPLAAEKAEAWEMIWKIVDDGALMAEAERLCVHFAVAPAEALAFIKAAFRINSSVQPAHKEVVSVCRPYVETGGMFRNGSPHGGDGCLPNSK